MFQATLYYQIVYKIQNRVFDLGLSVNNEALLVSVNLNRVTTCDYVARQVPEKTYIVLACIN